MLASVIKTFRKLYNQATHSIAFLPALMGLAFLLLAIVFLELDNAGFGEQVNRVRWLTLRDPSTASTILATVAGGIISLMVFSFSMVMIIMSQAASQMSNRMLDNIIGARVQKIVLGFYTGTLVFTLFVLTNISDDSTASVPSLSIYFLLILTVFDIFLFIYFLHSITHAFRYEQQIQSLHGKTVQMLEKLANDKRSCGTTLTLKKRTQILSAESGYYQGFDHTRMLNYAQSHNLVIEFLHPIGSYILKGTPILCINGQFDDKAVNEILLDLDFYYGQEVDRNAYYGFVHLTEVSLKALSPAINDPGTAVLAINALTDLLSRFMKDPIENGITDTEGTIRVITKQLNFEELFISSVLPIFDYGLRDRRVRIALIVMLRQLVFIGDQLQENFLQRYLLQLEAIQKEPETHLR
jgi:uncharacterized membrane protein